MNKNPAKPTAQKARQSGQHDARPSEPEQSAVDHLKHFWGNPDDPESRAIYPERERARAGLNWLAKKAHKGDEAAFRCLVAIVAHSVNTVRALTTLAPQLARKIAMDSTEWPVNITNSADFPENLDALREKLNIGANYPLGFNFRVRLDYKSKYKRREITIFLILVIKAIRAFEKKKLETVEMILATRTLRADLQQSALSEEKRRELKVFERAGTALANRTHKEILALGETVAQHITSLSSLLGIGDLSRSKEDAVRKALELVSGMPVLSTSTIDEWFKPMKEFILVLTDGAPERNPVLKKIGEYQADSYFRKGKSAAQALEAKKKAQQEGKVKRTVESNIRGGIFTKLKDQLRSLVKREKP